jgi:hypothetical protein
MTLVMQLIYSRRYNSSAKAAEENAATITKEFGVKAKAIQIPAVCVSRRRKGVSLM